MSVTRDLDWRDYSSWATCVIARRDYLESPDRGYLEHSGVSCRGTMMIR
jgi:hypothetical protein